MMFGIKRVRSNELFDTENYAKNLDSVKAVGWSVALKYFANNLVRVRT